MPVKKKPAKPVTPAELVIKHLKARALGALHYGRSDDYLRALRAMVETGEAVELGPEFDQVLLKLLGEKKFHRLGEKKQATVIDVFAGEDKVFRSHGIARFEVEVSAAS